ncbi:hypothetical protein EU527_05145 [Candidatus Thorarchaeota archaeon]|nr:MAG: hypothetical protein EU527_05145 [Candidatus Thorarchaeota archaeon]
MSINNTLAEALELCGFIAGDRQESRMMNILGVILRLQSDPPIPLNFSDIYDQLMKEDPNLKLSKAWVHRVLKSLVDAELIRIENPTAHRKRYIADVNTVMAGLERLKNLKLKDLESKESEIKKSIDELNALDCGRLSQEFIKNVAGREEEVSSRVVRGVDELHRVLRYNMLDFAKKGDVVRATLLWVGPWINNSTTDRLVKFFEAAERGADIRYLVTTDIFKMEDNESIKDNLMGLLGMVEKVIDMRKRGIKFNAKFYSGPKTYNQITFNRESMALIINENPVTATWITRKFNPDLIDNAVRSFDKDWRKGKSVLEMNPKDFEAFGASPRGLISKILSGNAGKIPEPEY